MTTLVLQKKRNSARYSLITKLFAVIIFLIATLALFPPFYLGISGNNYVVFGLPLAVLYWSGIPVLVGLALWVYYLIECALGELSPDEDK